MTIDNPMIKDLLFIFNTMSFNGGNVNTCFAINENTIYLEMFNEPDLIFTYYSQHDWSLCTALNKTYPNESRNGGGK